MLIFISDMHLTDQSLAPSVPIEAFDLFVQEVKSIAEKAKSKQIEIIFLGDIFDVLRSQLWLVETIGTELKDTSPSVRPWSLVGPPIEHVLVRILEKIEEYYGDIFRDLSKKFKLTWVPGNHDRLVSTTATGRQFLKNIGVTWEGNYEIQRLGYRVFARHGQRFDEYNFLEAYQYSPLGDALVVEILNKLQVEIARRSGEVNFDNPKLAFLGAMEYIRPLTEVPGWVHDKAKRHRLPQMRNWIREEWKGVVDDFKNNDFWKINPFKNQKRKFSLLLKVLEKTRGFKFLPETIIKAVKSIIKGQSDNYLSHAKKESILNDDERYCYVVYGHTHEETKPFALSNHKDKFYANTGWWERYNRNDKPFMGHFNMLIFPARGEEPFLKPIPIDNKISWQSSYKVTLSPKISIKRAQQAKQPTEKEAFLEKALIDLLANAPGIKVKSLQDSIKQGYDMVVSNNIKKPTFGRLIAVDVRSKTTRPDIVRLAENVKKANTDGGWLFTLGKVSEKAKVDATKSRITVFDSDDIGRFESGEDLSSFLQSYQVPIT